MLGTEPRVLYIPGICTGKLHPRSNILFKMADALAICVTPLYV